jgi:hypothetical protein
MWLSLSLVTTTIFLVAGIEVHSNGACPSGDAVTAKLARAFAGARDLESARCHSPT